MSYAQAASILQIVPICGSLAAVVYSIVLRDHRPLARPRDLEGPGGRRRAPPHPPRVLLLRPRLRDLLRQPGRRSSSQMRLSAEVSLLRLRAPVGRLPLGAIFGGIGLVAADGRGGAASRPPGHSGVRLQGGDGPALPGLREHAGPRAALRPGPARRFRHEPLATVGALVLVPWAIADLVLLTRGRALRRSSCLPGSAACFVSVAVARRPRQLGLPPRLRPLTASGPPSLYCRAMANGPRPYVSVVVPLYNEVDNVEELYRELTASLESLAPALRARARRRREHGRHAEAPGRAREPRPPGAGRPAAPELRPDRRLLRGFRHARGEQ